MSYDNPATHGLFEELLAGATAVKERPQLIAERDSALSEVEFHKSRLNDNQAELDKANAALVELQDKLRGMEDAYNAATFRETEVRTKLESLVTTFKAVIGEVKAAADLANELVEEPKPIENPTANVDGQETTASTQNADAAQGNTDSVATDAVSVSSDTDLPGKFPWEAPKIGDAEDAHMYAAGTFQPTEAAREPEVNPTAPSTIGTSETAQATFVEPQSAASISGNNSRPYWEKPSNVTWFEWRTLGNEIAPWCKNAGDEALKSIFH